MPARLAACAHRADHLLPLVAEHLQRLAWITLASKSSPGLTRSRMGSAPAYFGEVPPKVAKLIKQGAYSKVSSEVYDEPPEGIRAVVVGPGPAE
jgi:hypothetical protein